MARYADIRIFLPSVLPGASYTELSKVLNNIIQAKPYPVKFKTVSGNELEVTSIDKEKFSIGKYTFVYSDIKKALGEYQLLSEDVPESSPLLITKLFTPGFVNDLGGVHVAGMLAGRIHSLIMKRHYNWARLGSDSDVDFEYNFSSKPVATVFIHDISREESLIQFQVTIKNKAGMIFSKCIALPLPIKKANKQHTKKEAEPFTVSLETIYPSQEPEPKVVEETPRPGFLKSLASRFKLDKIFA